jgi:dTDP-4-amino-4,6-dideoxygalactose transaminase
VIPIMRPQLPPLERYVELLRRVWDSHMLSNFGPLAREFEGGAQRYLGNSHVRAIASGDIGMIAAIAALDLPEGSEAIVPSFTFNSTVNAIAWNGLVPVFADIDRATLNADPADVAAAITSRTSLIVATHVFGNPCDADALKAAARGIPVIFDAAHAYGSRYRGRACGGGTLGTFEVFSFSGTKLVTSAEGGLVAAADGEMARKLEYLRAYGFQGDYESHMVGLNGKLSELHAALGMLTIEMIEASVARRHEIAARYRELLADVPGIAFQRVDPRDRTTWKDFPLLLPDGATRDRVEAALTAQQVQTKRYFRPAHTMRGYRHWAGGPLQVTEDVYGRILCIPIFNELPDSDIERIADIVRGSAR